MDFTTFVSSLLNNIFAAEFYEIIESESSAVEFLRTHGLVLPDDINSSNCTKCDGVIKISLGKKRLATGEVRKYTTGVTQGA